MQDERDPQCVGGRFSNAGDILLRQALDGLSVTVGAVGSGPVRSMSALGTAYHVRGDGEPLVFVHGVGLNADSWQFQIESLSSSYKVHAIDMLGHGESTMPDGPVTIDHYVRQLHDFIEDVVGAPAAIVGHSMGALVALNCAIDNPQICTKVVAVNAVFERGSEAREAILERAKQLYSGTTVDSISAPVARWFGENPQGEVAVLAAQCRHWLESVDRRAYAVAYHEFARHDGVSAQRLATLACPALFLTGEDDPNSTPVMSKSMAGIVPNGRALFLKGQRHMPMLGDSQGVIDVLRDFLSDPTPVKAHAHD